VLHEAAALEAAALEAAANEAAMHEAGAALKRRLIRCGGLHVEAALDAAVAVRSRRPRALEAAARARGNKCRTTNHVD
jgi:hypothetical protein